MFARLSLLFASAGLFIASYLTATYYSGVLIPCGPQGGCSDALYNPAYHIKGVPLAAVGLVYSLVLAGSILFWLREDNSEAQSNLRFISGIGFFITLILNLHLSSMGTTCLWCMAFLMSVFACYLCASVKANSKRLGSKVLLAMIVPLIASSAGLFLGSRERDVDELDPRLLAQHANQMISLESPRVGRPGRSVVLFGEIACPSCRIAMNKLLPYAEGGNIQLVIRHLPIESHPISREACILAQLAAKEHKLPALIRAVDGRIINTKAELESLSKELNLPLADEGDTKQIDADANFAHQLGITGAPTLIWIDGNKLPQHLSLSEIESRLNQ